MWIEDKFSTKELRQEFVECLVKRKEAGSWTKGILKSDAVWHINQWLLTEAASSSIPTTKKKNGVTTVIISFLVTKSFNLVCLGNEYQQ